MSGYNRRGLARTYAAEELAERMKIPVWNLIKGYASPTFPYTSRSAPSYFVQVSLIEHPLLEGHQRVFPVTVSGIQWKEVIEPLLNEGYTEGAWGTLTYEEQIEALRQRILEIASLKGW